jgi:hypothetical protein
LTREVYLEGLNRRQPDCGKKSEGFHIEAHLVRRQLLILLPIQKVSFLGHILTAEGVVVDPEKVTAVANWRRPTTVTEIRSFLGLAGYYRRFIEGFSKIARPMTKLLQKEQKFD